MYKVPKRDNEFGVGKRMGDNLYFHISYADEIIGPKRFSFFNEILNKVLLNKYGIEETESVEATVLKWNEKKGRLSFIYCPGFFDELEPGLEGYILIDSNTESGSRVMYTTNFPIYHHKWLMVKDDFKQFKYFTISDLKERSRNIEILLNCGLFDIDISRIGMYNYWSSEVVPVLDRMYSWQELIKEKLSEK